MMPVDRLTLIRPTSSILCAVTQLLAHQRQTDGRRKRVDLRTTLAEKFTMESTSYMGEVTAGYAVIKHTKQSGD